jgi:adenylosuccinate synthase
MRQVVLISGRICTGKSGLARRLKDEFGYYLIRTSKTLAEVAKQRGLPSDRMSLQALGDVMDTETHHRWVLDTVEGHLSSLTRTAPVVVDNIRTAQQLEHFRQNHDWVIVHAHLYAPISELERRFQKKNAGPGRGTETYGDADLLKKDSDIAFFMKDADVRINTGRSDGLDTLVRVAARLGLYSPPHVRCVDVLVGGQYGSEGKGHVAAYLARDYDVLLRVGGPNAGHTVSSASGVYTYHQLPSGARDTDAKLLLGPGMTLNVDRLLDEIAECGVTPQRLFIDPEAMIIELEDLEREKELVTKIGSTGQGGGAAAARRILNRKPGAVRLARDISELRPFVGTPPLYRGSTRRQLEFAYREGQSILLEGTQGSGLSLYHGSYPHVTSRDTNVAGCLAEAGISPNRVRRVLMVVRPTPIRVGNPDGEGTSGRLKHEVTFDEVANSAGLDPTEVKNLEKTSTTKRDRRVGWFEWEQFREACALNAPTDIVLTFADYFDGKNRNARRFEQLTQETISSSRSLNAWLRRQSLLLTHDFLAPRRKKSICGRSLIEEIGPYDAKPSEGLRSSECRDGKRHRSLVNTGLRVALYPGRTARPQLHVEQNLPRRYPPNAARSSATSRSSALLVSGAVETASP